MKQLKDCYPINIKSLILNTKSRFIIIGGLNTIIGYFVVAFTYTLLSSKVGIITIGIISNIIAITIAFTLHKIFVFKTKGNWLKEYLRSYITYASIGILGIFLLWLFVEKLNLSIWISQGIIILITVVISFFGHKKITFKKI